MRWTFHSLATCLIVLLIARFAMGQHDFSKIEFSILEKKTGKPVPCRVHIKDKNGKPQRAGALPFWYDHFVCQGAAQLQLPSGEYSYEVERGPEYAMATGTFMVKEKDQEKVNVELERLLDLTKEGWWSGDLHVHRPVTDIELLMRAEDIHLAPVITWWNNRNEWAGKALPENPLVQFDQNRYYHVMAGEDEREGGALLYFNLQQPLAITGANREHPSPMKFVSDARRHKNVWIDVEKPFWWDAPVWLASGEVDSIGLANNHMCRDKQYENEAWGKPRDSNRLPPPLGNGFWTQEIYYHVLNCGLRIPPSAGTASGVLPNPVGYNRVYVQLGDDFTWDKWWGGLRAGKVFVTNGPLLRVLVNGQYPGHVFRGPKDKEVDLDVRVSFASRDPVRFLEIIKNGQVERKIPYEDWAKTGTLGRISFQRSGWFLVRAITDNPKTFRFASTGPYYVEVGDVKNHISRASARFFLDWVQERTERIRLTKEDQKNEVLKHHADAKRFWEEILAKATGD
jgi:hypothetical protein